MATAQQIIADIDAYMKEFPKSQNKDWYVGIAADARERLFTGHGVAEKGGAGGWIYRKADSHTIARAVEKAYHAAGCDGGPGGGDENTDKVYAYLKTSATNP
jgi:hypothetical protein